MRAILVTVGAMALATSALGQPLETQTNVRVLTSPSWEGTKRQAAGCRSTIVAGRADPSLSPPWLVGRARR